MSGRLLDGIRIDYYGTQTPLNQLASVSVPESRMLTVKPYEQSLIPVIEKVVRSAVANATENSETVDVDNLFIEKAYINEGPRLKRIRPAPMGRAFRYVRRMSHVTIELGERE